MKYRYLLSFCFYLISHSIFAKSNILYLPHNLYRVNPTPYVWVAKQPIVNDSIPSNFVKNTKSSLNFGLVEQDIWIKFEVQAELDEMPIILEVQNPNIDTLELIYFQDNQFHRMERMGCNIKFESRSINYRNPSWKINIKKNQVTTIYVHANRKGQAIQFPVLLKSEKAFNKSMLIENILIGIYIGTLFILFILLISLYFRSGDKVYILYALHILFTTMWQLSNFGISFQFLWPNSPLWNGFAKNIFSVIAIICFVEFSFTFLAIKSIYTRIYYFIRISQIGVLMAFLLALYSYLQHHALHSTLTAFANISLLCCLLSLLFFSAIQFKKSIQARIYLIAFLFLCIFSFVSVIESTGFLVTNFFTSNAVAIGNFIEILIIAVGMSFAYTNNLKKYNESVLALSKSQQEAYEQSLQLIENERDRIAADLHDIIGSELAGIKLKTQMALEDNSDTVDIIQNFDNVYHHLRILAKDLKPINWSQHTLTEMLQEKVSFLNKVSKIDFQVKTLIETESLNEDQKMHLYAIVAELLQNTLKHSDAKHANIILNNTSNFIELIVQDDGKGFQTSTNKGIGFENVYSRAQKIGGKIKMQSSTEGTKISILIPVNY
jgi:signal transduction histidine kinase